MHKLYAVTQIPLFEFVILTIYISIGAEFRTNQITTLSPLIS